MRVQPAAADLMDETGPALHGQCPRADLPGGDLREQQGGVERIAGNMQPRRLGPVEGDLERILLLDGAVSLDDHHPGRGQAHHLRVGRTAE